MAYRVDISLSALQDAEDAYLMRLTLALSASSSFAVGEED